MSRSAPKFASGRFAPAAYGLLIALAMIAGSFVVRRELDRRGTSPPTDSPVSTATPVDRSAAPASTGSSGAESATVEINGRSSDGRLFSTESSDETPALPRVSSCHAATVSPFVASKPSAGATPASRRVRASVADAGLTFPPPGAAQSVSAPLGDARQVAATADDVLPGLVVPTPSMGDVVRYPWSRAEASPRSLPPVDDSPPPPQQPTANVPTADSPSIPSDRPPTDALTTAPPSTGVLRFPDAAPWPAAPPQSSASPIAPPRAPLSHVAHQHAAPVSVADHVASAPVPQATEGPRFDVQPAAAGTAVLVYPATTQPVETAPQAAPSVAGAVVAEPAFVAGRSTTPQNSVIQSAVSHPALPQSALPQPAPASAPTFIAGPTTAPPAESLPYGLPAPSSPAAGPPLPRAIPNPWSSFAASASLGRFTEHGTITLADVRLTALQNNKDVAVLGYVPRVAAAGIDAEASVFDPTFNIAFAGGHFDRQTATQIESLGSSIPELKTSFWQPITAPNQVWVEKKFVTGGDVQLGVGQNYLNYSPAGSFVLVNPTHQASVNLSVEQPLFRGRGPAATLAATEIARANGAQSWHAFQASVNQILRDAEAAYWETYAAYQEFEVRDLALAQARATVDRERERLRIGEGSVPDVAQAEEQAEAFHIERTRAEIELIQAQRNLRRLMGLPPGDERPLIPATDPADEPPPVDWETAAAEARNRPEFAAQAAAVEAAAIEVRRRRNGMLPDLSLQGVYAVSGLDSGFGDAWGSLGTFNYNDWTAGVVYKQPLGRRSDRALEQRAVEALSMESARLAQLEHEILHQLDAAYKNLQAAESLLDLHRRRREAAAVQLEARRELYLENRAQLRDQLDAESRYASAMLDEALAKTAYRRAVTDWNYARGAMTGDSVLVRQ